ncbi:unnamed protein product [Linum tenue]|uniref:ENTH domain-containing protein n=1 Tax=Linum tenue TaxID=586396 RepID=A0AAV0R3P0_9ROSI|nr:unnamed protein product [Linum tenue]
MPSKLRKAIGAVKDQTSISFAKISSTNASNLEVLILKATRHDDVPIDERYVAEVLSLISSSKAYAVACAHVISKRIGRTRNWIVALKSLMLVLRIFQDGDPYFPREVLHAMKRGARILNLSSFRDDSNSSPWDFTAFVRTFALYLDERLDCFITGKLQRRFTRRRDCGGGATAGRTMYFSDNMKPPMLLDRISYWQKLLDRAMATRPTGAAKSNRLVLICLYAVVQESFDLYKDISDGLALLLDSFFHLPYQSCATAFQACVKAAKQFEELCSYYDFCKSMGVGRTSEYPSVQKISEELIETLQEFLKDQASFPAVAGGARSPPRQPEGEEEAAVEGISSRGRQLSSLQELMGLAGMEEREEDEEPSMSLENQDMTSTGEDNNESSSSLSFDQGTTTSAKSSYVMDLLSLDDWDLEDLKLENEKALENSNSGWEIVLAEIATQSSTEIPSGFFDLNEVGNSNSPFGLELGTPAIAENHVLDHNYNPFLQDLEVSLPEIEIESKPLPSLTAGDEKAIVLMDDLFSSGTFQATPPTFSVRENHHCKSNELIEWKNEPELETVTRMTVDENVMALADDFFSTAASTFQARPTFSVQNTNNNQESGMSSGWPIETEQTTPAGDENKAIVLFDDLFTAAPSFQATPPTFSVENGECNGCDDLFGPWPIVAKGGDAMERENLLREQQMWLANQNKIITKNLCQ